jgi:hypothetical protein
MLKAEIQPGSEYAMRIHSDGKRPLSQKCTQNVAKRPQFVMESAKVVFCPDLESLGQFVPPALCAQRWILGGLT